MANNISIIGRVAADAELKYTPNGSAVLEFRIADDVGYGDKKVTNWWRCAMFGKQADGKLAEFLKKGQQVVVFGEATMREWTDKEGNKRMSPEVRVTSVQLAGQRQSGERSEEPQRQPANKPANKPKPSFDNLDDDIPW